jgi:tetratricopeptide (TPR) repeat protein
MRAFLLTLLLPLLAGCEADARARPLFPVAPDARCGHYANVHLFHRPKATHVLLTDFATQPAPSAPDFADSLATRLVAQARAIAAEHPTPDAGSTERDMEVVRLHCRVDRHPQARSLAGELGADLVVWGNTPCDLEPGAAPISEPGQPARVCPHLTLTRADRDIRHAERPELATPADLDLPALPSSSPEQLVAFAVGLHLHEQSRYSDAVLAFRKAAAIEGEARSMGVIDLYLGVAGVRAGDLPHALEQARKALARVAGTGSRLEAAALDNLGAVLDAQGDRTGALEHYHRALAVSEKALDQGHPDGAVALDNIGRALAEAGDDVGALVQYRRALSIDERVLGPQHLAVAIDAGNLGELLFRQKDYGGALEQYRRALAIEERELGPDDLAVGRSLNDICVMLRTQGDQQGAGVSCRRSLSIAERAMGPDDPVVAVRLNNLARVSFAQGDYEGALRLQRRALAIEERRLGELGSGLTVYLHGIVALLVAQGDHGSAVVSQRRIVAISEKALGPDDPALARELFYLGGLLTTQEDPADAVACLRRALAIDERALGGDSFAVAYDARGLANALDMSVDAAEAIALYRRALGIFTAKVGPEGRETTGTRDDLSQALAARSGWQPDGKAGGVAVVGCLKPGCAGLQPGDWIIAVGAKKLRDRDDFLAQLPIPPRDGVLTLTVVRDGKRLPVRAQLGRGEILIR